MRSCLGFSLLFAVIPLVACGGATSERPDGGGGADAGTTVGADASSPPEDAGEQADGTGPIVLQAFGGASGKVAAQVPLNEPGVGQERTCAAPVTSGSCQLTSCKLGGIGSPGGGYGDFGPMTASVGTTTVSLPYNGFGYPTIDFPASVTLEAGGTMTFRGGNGTSVPMFDVSATIPGLAVLESPVSSGGAVTVDTSQDLSLRWAAIPKGQIKFEIDGGSESIGGTAVSVACAFDGASGSGVVPQALLSSMKQMAGTSPASATLTSEIDSTTVVGGFTILTQGFLPSPAEDQDFTVTLE